MGGEWRLLLFVACMFWETGRGETRRLRFRTGAGKDDSSASSSDDNLSVGAIAKARD